MNFELLSFEINFLCLSVKNNSSATFALGILANFVCTLTNTTHLIIYISFVSFVRNISCALNYSINYLSNIITENRKYLIL